MLLCNSSRICLIGTFAVVSGSACASDFADLEDIPRSDTAADADGSSSDVDSSIGIDDARVPLPDAADPSRPDANSVDVDMSRRDDRDRDAGADDATVDRDAGGVDVAPSGACEAQPPSTVGSPRLRVGLVEVEGGQMYVVHTSMGNRLMVANTSNIFVIHGVGDEVVLFGTGYGDPNGDLSDYIGSADAMRSAQEDAADVAHAIERCIGIPASRSRITLIAPHGHLDHINQELPLELDALGHGPETIYVHANAMHQATCNAACCGGVSCSDRRRDEDFGAPYDPPWQGSWLAKFAPLSDGRSGTCAPLLSIPTEALGTLEVLHSDAAHGTVDGTVGGVLDVRLGDFYFSGSSSGCASARPASSTWAYVHENVTLR